MDVSTGLNNVKRNSDSLRADPNRRTRSFDLRAWCLVFGLVLSAFVLGSPFAENDALDPGSVVNTGPVSRQGADSCQVTPARPDLVDTVPTIEEPVYVPG